MERKIFRNDQAWVTGLLIAANFLYFLYLEFYGSTEDALCMLEHGAMYAPLVLEQGEYWRLVTSLFMHFGIEHLVNNMLVLFVLGEKLERALGKPRYLLFYFLCGIGANLVSLAFELSEPFPPVSAGASGAIFGVIGGLLYAVAVNRGRLEDLSTRQLVVVAVFSLYFGFTSTGVDNAAHVAGLVLGILAGALLYRKSKRAQRKTVFCREDFSVEGRGKEDGADRY